MKTAYHSIVLTDAQLRLIASALFERAMNKVDGEAALGVDALTIAFHKLSDRNLMRMEAEAKRRRRKGRKKS